MSLKESLKLVGGSIVVYVAMAACSATGGPQGFAGDDGGQQPGTGSSGTAPDTGVGGDGASSSGAGDGSGGEVADSSGSGSGSILDALTDPVRSALADVNQSGTRLKANYYAGADGSKYFLFTFHDTQRNEDCTFTTASDGTTRCMPSAGIAASYYTDSGCTQPVALVSACALTPTPKYVTVQVGTSSSAASHLFLLGSATSVSTAYQRIPSYVGDAGACGPGTLVYTCTALASSTWTAVTSNSAVYSVGAEALPSAFVQATVQTEP